MISVPDTTVDDSPGAKWYSRLWLGLVAMVGAWVISCCLLVLLKLTFQHGLEILLLAGWSGAFAAFTYCIFVAPFIAFIARNVQLHRFYIIAVLSFVWDALVFRGFFQQWPWTVHLTGPDLFFPIWFGVFTSTALFLYYRLIRNGFSLRRFWAEMETPRLLSPPKK